MCAPSEMGFLACPLSGGGCGADQRVLVPACPADCPQTVLEYLPNASSRVVRSCFSETPFSSPTVTPSPSGDALLVWVNDSQPRSCGSTRSATVFAQVVRGLSTSVLLSPRMNLGTTTDELGPSATFVDGVGFVVAHITELGAVELHQIPVDAPTMPVDPPRVLLAELTATSLGTNTATTASQVSLATGDAGMVAVTFTDGSCAGSNRVMIQPASVTASAATWGTALAIHPTATETHLAPVASRNGAGRRGEWVVFYRQATRDEYAVRILPDLSRTVGDPIAIRGLPVEGRPMLNPDGTSWGFVTSTSTPSVVSGRLSCVDSM